MRRTFPARLAGAAVLVAAALAPSPASAQADGARRHLDDGLALAAAGDTAGAIRELEAAVRLDRKFGEAYLQLGRIYTHSAGWKETDFRLRRKAERALARALELEPDDPRALAELGHLRIKQHMKLDAGRILNRALELAQKRPDADPGTVAEIHYLLGYVSEREYERVRDRVFIPPTRAEISTASSPVGTPWLARTVDEYLRATARIEGMGESHKDLMLAHYRAAIREDRGHFGAHRRLMLYLLDDGLLDEYMLLARNLVRTNPDRPEAHLYLGLGLHALGREDEAGEAFNRGLAMLPERERLAFLNLEPTLRKRPGEQYLRLDGEARTTFEASFWRLSDPLYLTIANERRLEHLSRVAYADLRFSEPATGRRGWETDRGIIYIRYGAPSAVFRAGSIVWRYDDGAVFMFRQTPGYNRTLFAGDYRFIAQDYRAVEPSNYDNIPSIPELLDIPVQLARFRGPSSSELALEIHAALPLGRLARAAELERGEIDTGLFLLNSRGYRVVERKYSEIVGYADADEGDEIRSWRLLLPPGGLLVAAVEAREASSWLAAASRDTFYAVPFASDGSPKISDLLLGDAMRPLVKEPRRRLEYDFVPNPALEYAPGDAVHLYYELYDLQQDAEGFASYDVALQVKINKLYREGTVNQILGGLADLWGFTIAGDDRLELRFSREVDMKGRDRVTEYLRLELKDAPPGDYEIRVRIWDRLGERMATRTRAFAVVP